MEGRMDEHMDIQTWNHNTLPLSCDGEKGIMNNMALTQEKPMQPMASDNMSPNIDG